MIREIIEVKDKFYKIHLPKEYINKKVEILVFPLNEESKNKKLKAISIDTKNFQFNREEAHER